MFSSLKNDTLNFNYNLNKLIYLFYYYLFILIDYMAQDILLNKLKKSDNV